MDSTFVCHDYEFVLCGNGFNELEDFEDVRDLIKTKLRVMSAEAVKQLYFADIKVLLSDDNYPPELNQIANEALMSIICNGYFTRLNGWFNTSNTFVSLNAVPKRG